MGSTHLEYQAWESPPLLRVMRVEKSGSLGVLELGNLGTGKCGNWGPSKCGNLVVVDNEAMPQPGSSLLGRLRMWKVVRAPTLCLGNVGT